MVRHYSTTQRDDRHKPEHARTRAPTHTRARTHILDAHTPIPTQDLLHWSYLFIPLLTFGFWGLELVSVEINDPFGKDANDLDIQSLVDDTFATIADEFGLPKPAGVELRENLNKKD